MLSAGLFYIYETVVLLCYKKKNSRGFETGEK